MGLLTPPAQLNWTPTMMGKLPIRLCWLIQSCKLRQRVECVYLLAPYTFGLYLATILELPASDDKSIQTHG